MSKETIQNKLGLVSLGILTVVASGALLFPKEPIIPETSTEEFFAEEMVEDEVVEDEVVEDTQLLSENDQLTVDLVNELTDRLANQEKVDSLIQAEVESGYYTPENPLVILDPYSQSPLTALICFTTEEPTQVHLHVEGEDEYTEVNHSFSEFTTQHVVPVYGLYPDKLNPVTVRVYDEAGELLTENISEIQTEPVADHFQSLIILTETFQDGYQEGINFTYENGKMAFDKDGIIRWYSSNISYATLGQYTLTSNTFLFSKGSYHSGSVFHYELDKLGKVHNIYYSPYGAHHDITPMHNDSFLLAGTNTIGETVEDFVYEIDMNTGEIINTLDMKYVLQRTRPAGGVGHSNWQDWMHMNSIEYDTTDNTIIISSNHQSAVVKLDWPSGDIHWIMGNHDDWNLRMQQYLLTPIGDDLEWHYNQHATEILPDYDNNPDTIDILLFDNGSNRFKQNDELQRQIRNNEIVEPELYSRLVHYRINEVTMEVEQIWQYGKERGLDLFSGSRGDADLLENENILGMFAHDQPNLTNAIQPILSEVTKGSDLIWEAELFTNTATGQKYEYRAERLPFYFDDDAEHDIYTTARNLIPEEIMEFVQNYNENPPIIPTEGENTDETQTENTN